ncbi:MAG: hypothetical protein HYZ38_12755 [Mycobacterium sp.]|nr:hypothetical protein [Mycobacterium sp.]
MKLTITRMLMPALAMAAAVGLAASAYADPPLLNGAYSGGDDENVWTIATSCGITGCTGTVSSNQGWSVPATFTDGRWNFTVTKPDGVICDNGSYAPAYISLAVDPVTLAGTISTDSNYGCPGGDISQTPFQLTKVG